MPSAISSLRALSTLFFSSVFFLLMAMAYFSTVRGTSIVLMAFLLAATEETFCATTSSITMTSMDLFIKAATARLTLSKTTDLAFLILGYFLFQILISENYDIILFIKLFVIMLSVALCSVTFIRNIKNWFISKK